MFGCFLSALDSTSRAGRAVNRIRCYLWADEFQRPGLPDDHLWLGALQLCPRGAGQYQPLIAYFELKIAGNAKSQWIHCPFPCVPTSFLLLVLTCRVTWTLTPAPNSSPQLELMYHTFGRQRFKKTTANLDLFLRRFNEVQLWVATELCLCAQLSKRVQLLKKFIKIAAQWVSTYGAWCLPWNNTASAGQPIRQHGRLCRVPSSGAVLI